MALRSSAPLRLQENLMGRAGVRAHKAGERAVLAPLTENDQHSRALGPVSKSSLARHDVSTCDITTRATSADHVTEPVVLSANQSASFLLPSELLLLDDAVQDLGSGSCMDASMCSLSEEAAAPEDVLCVPEYAEDIHCYLRECEVRIFTPVVCAACVRLTLRSAGQIPAQARLHAEAAGHHRLHEGHPGGLAGGGGRGVQAVLGDAPPGRQLPGPLPVLHVRPEGEAAAAGHGRPAPGREMRGGVPAGGGGVRVHHGRHLHQGAAAADGAARAAGAGLRHERPHGPPVPAAVRPGGARVRPHRQPGSVSLRAEPARGGSLWPVSALQDCGGRVLSGQLHTERGSVAGAPVCLHRILSGRDRPVSERAS